jgi:hypothetical protein
MMPYTGDTERLYSRSETPTVPLVSVNENEQIIAVLVGFVGTLDLFGFFLLIRYIGNF